MRIAYIINSLEGGGAAAPVPAVVRVMAASGATVEVFALSRRDGRAIPGFDAADVRWSVSPAGKSQHLRAASWLWGELRRFRPTCLWTSLTQATLIGQAIGRMLGLPVASWQHNAFLRPGNLALLRRTRALTALWVADSESVAELSSARLGVPAGRMAVWPLFEARPDAPQAAPWRPGETFRLGSLGRLHPNKGYDVLIDALARLQAMTDTDLPPFEVLVGGEGGQRAQLEAKAAAHGVTRFRLAGFQRDPGAFLAGLHGYLQPSRAEGLCIAAHEAMQAGLPVIAADVGEMPRSIHNREEGFVTPSEDAPALADAIVAILKDPGRSRQMGQAARQRVLERFGQDRFAAAGGEAVARLAAMSKA
ncbi:glycosyltransferase family 4 protein [Phenylobacterium sp.]|uniref:glycosyltransferase family 4 protein n=1 Tax=Phenylobacterium sp. TaxID=1871053 RepID=UPI002F3F67E3